MKELLNYLFSGETLKKEEAYKILVQISEGQFTEAEIASFLTVFRMRKIKPVEMDGFRQALLELCIRIDFGDANTIDIVGTGGDGKDTFNISTLSSFVVAGAGYQVTKHGNYGLSSVSGSSNMFEFFGYKFSNDETKLNNELDKAGICFLHAPLFHPAMKSVASVRKSLKVKTLFNLMGPLINPAFPKNQMVGVYDLEIMDLYNDVLSRGNQNYIIVNSLDGYDEISLTGDARYISNNTEDIISADDFGFKKINQQELYGGNSIISAAGIFKNVLECKATEAQQNVVIANAALGILCFNTEKSIKMCVAEARESLLSKKAHKAFTILMELNSK